ncbi:MAG: hypothetical protein KGJ09_06180 [Candidatus Omnitrophica bacterium]|nr:hypothetical protein [Candidatus Omnitrophota bacterium]MDE2009649.1 hypothetical protein [Candidatus Omnitrophota bacterium]MDE2214423.1 hypothetical protein [Candidatus Omnitrophota bacterium]MDE2231563.1 hypothetical protein [Candidatus Omnitrophota bacterium]
MKPYDWDDKKSRILEKERGVCFEDIVIKIEEGCLLDNIEHPNKVKYAHQRMLIVNVNNYAYAVPFFEDEKFIHLITIFPSRELTKVYLGGEQ